MHGRVASLALAALLLPAASAAAAVPPGNLLANPGAEAAPGAPDSVTVDPPAGWTAEGSVTAAQYGAPDFPTTADSAALGGGVNFFAGGPDSAATAATQTVAVVGAAAEIDAGEVTATVSGDFGGYADQNDNATLTATYLNGDLTPLGTLATPAVTATDRQDTTALLARSVTGDVPPGTRAIGVRLDLVRTDGAYDDGYADNLSLTLSTAPQPVFHKTVVAGRVSGTIRFRKPGATSFVTLGAADQALPLGSTLDTTHGVMELSSVPKAGAAAQTSRFYAGQFKVTQPGGVTDLRLTQPLAACHGAAAAAKRSRSRKLWGSGHGSFRVSGQYSSATVRGTKWLVEDTCAGTLTRVVSGVVKVRDDVRHKTVVVRAGKRYLARPKRR